MRKTIYLSEESDKDVIVHIEKLEKDKVNVSGFFVNAAKYYLKHYKADSKDIEDIVKEIIEKEYKNAPRAIIESKNYTKDNLLKNKLKNIGIYDD